MRGTQRPPVDADAGTRRRLTRRPVVITFAVLAVAAIVVTLTVFEPQALFIDERVDDAAPTSPAAPAADAAEAEAEVHPEAETRPEAEAAEPEGAGDEEAASDEPVGDEPGSAPADGAAEAQPEAPAAPAEPTEAADPVVLGQGGIRGLDHRATGDALLLQLADGQQVLRFENLDAENGPDLWVYLSAAPADGPASAHTDDFVDLGKLQGNQGNQNYEIPTGVDTTHYRTAVIWCKRFSVGFAAAPLA